MYAQLLAKFPGDRLAADALYALGVSQEELKQQAEAGKSYDLFLEKYPQNPLADEVTVRRGETLFALGQFEQAAERFAAAAAKPEFALADHATVRQAAALAQLKKYAEAAALYASVATKWPQSKLVAAATLAGGKCYYLAGNFAAAHKLLDRALAAGGQSSGEAAHWLVRSLLKEGKPAEAAAEAEKLLAEAGRRPAGGPGGDGPGRRGLRNSRRVAATPSPCTRPWRRSIRKTRLPPRPSTWPASRHWARPTIPAQ